MRIRSTRRSVGVLAIVMTTASLILGSISTQGAPSQAIGDPRFGIAVGNPPPNLQAGLAAVGATTYYDFGSIPSPATGGLALIRPFTDLTPVLTYARANPGGAYMIGNEPNVPGQDDLTPSAYADFLHNVAVAIRGADASAILVGPNVLNWDDTCMGCAGYTSGHTWSINLASIYGARYGPFPLNAWAMHSYYLNWTSFPMIDPAWDQRQITGAHNWLVSTGINLPLWITEFGIIWAYPDGVWTLQSDGVTRLVPIGSYQTTRVASYIDTMLGWLAANSASLRIDRWYLAFLTPTADNYSSVANGIALLQPNSVTPNDFGQQFLSWATTRAGPTATPTLTATCSPRPTPQVQTTAIGNGRLQVTVREPAGSNAQIRAVRFGASTNAFVDIGSATGLRDNVSFALSAGSTQMTFVIRQAVAGQAATVPLFVVDSCGDWQTLAGGGPAAFRASPAPGEPAAPLSALPESTRTPLGSDGAASR